MKMLSGTIALVALLSGLTACAPVTTPQPTAAPSMVQESVLALALWPGRPSAETPKEL